MEKHIDPESGLTFLRTDAKGLLVVVVTDLHVFADAYLLIERLRETLEVLGVLVLPYDLKAPPSVTSELAKRNMIAIETRTANTLREAEQFVKDSDERLAHSVKNLHRYTQQRRLRKVKRTR